MRFQTTRAHIAPFAIALFAASSSLAFGQLTLFETATTSPQVPFSGDLATLDDVDGDGFRDFAIGIPYSNAHGHNSGGVRVMSGTTGQLLYTVYGPPSSLLGITLVGLGDLNGDGAGDWAAGMPNFPIGGVQRGLVRVYSGLDGSILFAATGSPTDLRFGHALCSTIDENGDGVRDLAVSVPGQRVAILSGVFGAPIREVTAPGTEPNFGSELIFAGDWNADGFADLLAASPESTFGDSRLFLLPGGPNTNPLFVYRDTNPTGMGELALLDDWNGDGRSEVGVLNIFENSVAIVSPLAGLVRTIQGPPQFHNATFTALGDVTGDGIGDLAIGNSDEGPGIRNNGAVRIYAGGLGTQVLSLIGSYAQNGIGSEFGRAVCALDDINQDGLADFAVMERGNMSGRVTAFGGDAGSVAGDSCSNPIVIPEEGRIAFNTNGNTASGHAFGNPCDAIGGKDIYFLWYPQDSASISTEGSSFDTILNMAYGTECDATCLYSNDDALAGASHSRVFYDPPFNNQPENFEGRLIRVGGAANESGPGVLTISNSSIDCVGLADDIYVGNQSCDTAVSPASIFENDLVVLDGVPDFFRFCVEPGDSLTLRAYVDQPSGVKMSLWLAATNACGDPTQWTPLANSISLSTTVEMGWSNQLGQRQEVVAKIETDIGDACSPYSLFLGWGLVPTCPAEHGFMVCSGVPNSTGIPATLRLIGSEVAAENNLVLSAEQVPLNQTVLFLASQGQGLISMPGGSMGNLCLGGGSGIARLNAIVGMAFGGFFQAQLDLTAIPIPTLGVAQIQSGQTWNFQAWYRDGSSSNFSDAIGLLFQ